ncbi:glycosyl transferase family 1, partial [Neisseria meningitidis]
MDNVVVFKVHDVFRIFTLSNFLRCFKAAVFQIVSEELKHCTNLFYSGLTKIRTR